ncbi:MAG: DedA family protein [Deltaproteobacteria bacterium]|nr:DedA family protein [Deltaproteobacteria bacterium]
MEDLFALVGKAIDIFLHLDRHLLEWTATMGAWLYLLLFVIIFCETGLVVTPFLPGDSLLFAVGAICAIEGSPLSVVPVILLLIVAGVIGDAVNYSIGLRVGPKVFRREDSIWLNKRHLLRAQEFYERYGGKAIVLARFVPIVRTFAPFVAGIGQMKYRRFAIFNIAGATAWVSIFVIAGWYFGNLEYVKRNFHYVILAIIVLSVMPAAWEYWRERQRAAQAAPAGEDRASS